MPMIIKTAAEPDKFPKKGFFKTVRNMAIATSKAIGSDYTIVSDTDLLKQYFVPTDPIGYPGLGIFFEVNEGATSSGDDDTYRFGIVNSSDISEGAPNIFRVFKGANIHNTLQYCAETCVMIYDKEKDTVLFDIHPGETLNGTDLNGFENYVSRRSRLSFAAFFAKDVNGGILCGIGNGHITSLRTLNSKMDQDADMTRPQKDTADANVLHLTKMVNYLDPSFPEMKSAYVSVIRPLETDDSKLYVSTLYAGGKRWGRAGLINSWPLSDEYNTSDYPSAPAFFPIEPFVNY